MKKIVILVLALLVFLAGCQGPFNIEDPGPIPIVKVYTLELYYTWTARVVGPYPDAYLTIRGGDNTFTRVAVGNMVYIDDQHFKIVFNGVGPNLYCLDATDGARRTIGDMGTMKVGEIFDIKVFETSVTTRLNDIRENTLPTNPYPGPSAKMACFQLTNDGQIISNQM
jgi:hypothetical protein